MNQIIVTTGDLQQPYDVLGPVYFQVSNKGLLSSSLDRLTRHYSEEIRRMRERGSMSEFQADWGFLYGEWSVGQSQFEAAFYIATQELKKRAKLVGADAIIGMRQDIDMDTNGFAYFYLQMYGTAVKLRKGADLAEQYAYAEELMDRGDYTKAESIFFQLGEFRDSREKAKVAYAMSLSSAYSRAEQLMAEKKYAEAERLFLRLRNYMNSKEMAAKASEANKQWLVSLASSRKQEAEAQQSASRSWTCPVCGKENVYFISKCSCGAVR